jgi:spoIIIJ-associated protein
MKSSGRTAGIVVTAATEEEAIEEALDQLGVERDAIEFEVNLESKSELLEGAKPQVELRAWIRPEYIAELAEDIVLDIMDLMRIEAEVVIRIEEGVIHVDVEAGKDASLLIGRDGQNLAAMQYLLNRMIIREAREAPMVVLDIQGYLSKQFGELENLVDRAVERARETGNEIELDPMPPLVRKYLHNYLKRYDDVKTFSRGEDPERYLVIIAD